MFAGGCREGAGKGRIASRLTGPRSALMAGGGAIASERDER
jgi:hypothetical protein